MFRLHVLVFFYIILIYFFIRGKFTPFTATYEKPEALFLFTDATSFAPRYDSNKYFIACKSWQYLRVLFVTFIK